MHHQNNRDESKQPDLLADLQLNSEQAAQTTAGAGYSGGVRVAVGDFDCVR